MSICERLKKNHSKKIRELSEIGTSIEALMYVCGNGTEKTSSITTGSTEGVREVLQEGCGKQIQIGEIHTHVAPIRTDPRLSLEEADKYESHVSLEDMDSALIDILDFTCVVRGKKMECRDMTVTNVYKVPDDKRKTAEKLYNMISDAQRLDNHYLFRKQAPPKSFFKLLDTIDKGIPKCNIDI